MSKEAAAAEIKPTPMPLEAAYVYAAVLNQVIQAPLAIRFSRALRSLRDQVSPHAVVYQEERQKHQTTLRTAPKNPTAAQKKALAVAEKKLKELREETVDVLLDAGSLTLAGLEAELEAASSSNEVMGMDPIRIPGGQLDILGELLAAIEAAQGEKKAPEPETPANG